MRNQTMWQEDKANADRNDSSRWTKNQLSSVFLVSGLALMLVGTAVLSNPIFVVPVVALATWSCMLSGLLLDVDTLMDSCSSMFQTQP